PAPSVWWWERMTLVTSRCCVGVVRLVIGTGTMFAAGRCCERAPAGNGPLRGVHQSVGKASGFPGLQLPEGGVLAALAEEVVVGAGLHDAAFVHDVDGVRVTHGGETVRDDEA